jgi:undecaprenyl-diphosphatase
MDRELFLVINHEWINPVLDWWSALVRATSIWLVPALVLLALIAWRGSRRARAAAATCIVVFAISDGVFVRTLKIVSQRPRPAQVLDDVRSVRLARVAPRVLALARPLEIGTFGPANASAPKRSFPSGHAWNSFAIATVIALYCRRWGWFAFVPAALIGFARIHAGLHWPTDVLASAVLSPPCTLGLVVALDRTWRMFARRFAPRWIEALPNVLERAAT